MKKLLLLCQDNIGDLVFTSSLSSQLSNQGFVVTLATRPDTAAISQFLPGVNAAHSFALIDKIDPFFHWKKHAAFWAFVRWLREQEFNVAISVSKNWRIGFALFLARIPTRIGWKFPKLAPFLTHAVPRPSLSTPAITALQQLVATFDLPLESNPPYSLDLARVASATPALCIQKGSSKWVGLHAFASLSNRCVALETWLKVAREINEKGYCPVWFGTSSELDKLRAIDSSTGLFSDALCNGQLDQVVPLLSYCDGYIGHDSGILHLASAMNIPNLGIFTPGEPKRTFPQGRYKGSILFRESPHQLTAQDIINGFESKLEPTI